jgi:hypothetical protein
MTLSKSFEKNLGLNISKGYEKWFGVGKEKKGEDWKGHPLLKKRMFLLQLCNGCPSAFYSAAF